MSFPPCTTTKHNVTINWQEFCWSQIYEEKVNNVLDIVISNFLNDAIINIFYEHVQNNMKASTTVASNHAYKNSVKMGNVFSWKNKFWYIILGVVMVMLIIFVAIFATVSTLHINEEVDCTIDLNKDLTFQHPLILSENGESFLNPGPQGIHLMAGEKLLIACSGNNNHIAIASNKRELILECVNKNIFVANDGNEILKHPFKDFKCTSYPESEARKTGNKCSGSYTELEIGFRTSKGFINLITTCFNDAKKDSLYSYYNLMGTIDQQQIKVPRPNGFHQGGFYEELQASVDNLYKKTHELSTVSKLLKSDELAKKYIKNDDDFFLSRGHMTAKADFLYGSQQRATFYFINIAPQWEIFNKKNWNILEQDVRSFAAKQKQDLAVYTGVWGVSKLPDTNNAQVSLYLYLDRTGSNHQLTVPEVYWKIVYHKPTKKAIAFVGHNNPYEQDVQQHTICRNICDQVDWLNWRAANVTEGFSYCCNVDELRSTVTYLPELEISGLLV